MNIAAKLVYKMLLLRIYQTELFIYEKISHTQSDIPCHLFITDIMCYSIIFTIQGDRADKDIPYFIKGLA